MEEATGDQSEDQQQSTSKADPVPTQSPIAAIEDGVPPLAESTRLQAQAPASPEGEELQEHRDTILRQQMLGRLLLSELSLWHQAKQENITNN